ncbi:hypothetical protein ACOSQ4_010621 [Xanthoceras sorbifolium]
MTPFSLQSIKVGKSFTFLEQIPLNLELLLNQPVVLSLLGTQIHGFELLVRQISKLFQSALPLVQNDQMQILQGKGVV